MNPISVVIITFNEEQNIERCINSVQGIADEIIIIDSYSTDRTKEICQKYSSENLNSTNNLKFFENPFNGYVEQKNYAISKATHSLILSLDADEALSDTLKTSILDIKNTVDEDILANVYEMARLTNYCGSWIKHTDWYPDRKIRLFDKSRARWEGILLHETIQIEPNTTLKRLKGDILHYSFYSISQHIAQMNKFTDIGAKEAFQKGKKANIFIILGSPIAKFISSYVFRLGFLDGYAGFLVCTISAFASFLKYIKIRQLQK
jgi:glycosyltransferase involved in cell wall biosynthesis